jgi:hypothetical protein
MKLLVATSRTQGDRENDFSYCVEGELVYLGFVCAIDQDDPDGGCGCGRAFSGLNSHRPTTTAEIRDVDLTVDDATEAVTSSLEQGGWDPSLAAGFVAELRDIADHFRVGTVLGRRIDEVYAR